MRIESQPGPQTQFLKTEADIAILGGAAGGGKTFGLLLDPMRHYYNSEFGGVIFRKTSVQVRTQGGLWDESSKIYPVVQGVPKEFKLEWVFPTGMNMSFGHLEYDKDVFNYQGAQIPWIGWDELTHFSEKQFFYMLSRNRSVSGVKPKIRATCNPDPDSWVKKFISWWLDENQEYSDPKKTAVLRWFIRRNDEMIWADSKEELHGQFGYGEEIQPKSVTFIHSKLQDNKILMDADPGYLGNLLALSRVDRMRLLDGNWKVKESAGMLFKREWFPILDAIPAGWIQAVRFWDRACLVADTKVITDHGEKEIQNIKVGDLVLTRKGFKKVIWSGISKRTKELTSVVFSNGSVISGTSCHPIYTNNRGWVNLSELKGTDIVLWKKQLSEGKDTSSLTEENITSTIKNTSTTTNGMESDVSISLDYFTETSGNFIMAPSPMAILFTIKTETELTTELKILNVFQESITDNTTNQILQNQLISKIQNIEKKHLQLFQRECKNSNSINANIAELSFTLKASKQNIVKIAANLPDVPVYDLTVEDEHEFFANEILVHNSTKPSESNKDPDWTRGLKLFKYPNNTFLVADLKSARDTPGQIEKLIKAVASHDSSHVQIMSQQDPGSAGVSEAEHFIRMLIGYSVSVQTMSKDKITRAKPVSAQCEVGNIYVLRSPWNDEFFNELENFPDGSHDDIVDVFSGAFNAMSYGLSTADAMWSK